MKMRIQYAKISDLVATVDDKISHLILLSFANNLFLICKQLYESLRWVDFCCLLNNDQILIDTFRPLPTLFHMIYFWYSLTFLIMRTFAVSLFSARINDESEKPIKVLRTIPSHLWNEETKRFFGDILCKNVALSGLQFFFVTRKLILSVVGTIITYELVLFQFNRS